MRDLYIAVGVTLLVAAIFVAAVLFTNPQEHAHAQRNAYWPYSVEMQTRDM